MSLPVWAGGVEYPANMGNKSMLARIRSLAVWAGVWLWTSLMDVSTDVWEVVAH